MTGRTIKRLFLLALWTGGFCSVYPTTAQLPAIRAVDKTGGPHDEKITLIGSGFSTDPTKLAVFFGAARANISLATDQLLEVRVPAGATYDPISVTHLTTGLTGYSNLPFRITFGGEHGFDGSKLHEQLNFDSESGLYDLCMCDFNGDGKNDIATANNNSTSISVFRNTTLSPGNNNIQFQKKTIDLRQSIHVTCGDLNGDGKPDLVVTGDQAFNDQVFILRNTTPDGANDITFAPYQAIRFPEKKVKQLSIADLDLDGKPELIISHHGIHILVNQSTTSGISFSSTPLHIQLQKDNNEIITDALAVNDLDGDGYPEIITSHYLNSDGSIFILKNNSTSGNIAINSNNVIEIPEVGTIASLRVGDLDGDGLPDLAATQANLSGIILFRNQSTASQIVLSSPVSFATEQTPWGMDFGDLDGDGKTDIAVASITKNSISLLNNKSTPGNFDFHFSAKSTQFVHRNIRIGDIDGDARPDITFASIDVTGRPASKISVLRNKACLKPTISPEGPLNICVGASETLFTQSSPGTTYIWDNGVSSPVSTSVPYLTISTNNPVNYQYKVTAETEGCSLSSDIRVEVTVSNGSLTGTPVASNNGPVCIGSELQLSINDVGGTEYRWSGPNGYTGSGRNPAPIPDFKSTNAGRYTVEIILGSCVADRVSTVVEAVDVPEFRVNSGNATVFCTPGDKTIRVSPLLGDFSYEWFEQSQGRLISGDSYNVTATGSYYAVATHKYFNCNPVKTDVVNITFATPPVAAFEIPDGACAGQEILFKNTSTTDPSVQAFYNWNFGDGGTSPEKEPLHAFPSASASGYNVKLSVSYENNVCANEVTQKVPVLPGAVAGIINPDNRYAICGNEDLKLEVTGDFVSYLWNTGETTKFIHITEPGTYTVEATSLGGCVARASREIDTLPDPEIIVSADPLEVNEGESSQLSASGLVSYLWEPAETLSQADIPNPIATPLSSTVYTVRGADANGCTGEAFIEVRVKGDIIVNKVKPRKFFSPDNGDDLNRFWTIERILDFPQCRVAVFDDKGVKVFEAKPYTNDWDGTFNGKRLPDGVYYYIIQCEGDTGKPKTGSITLLR